SGLGTTDVLSLRRPHRRGRASADRRPGLEARQVQRQTMGPVLARCRHRCGAGAANGIRDRRLRSSPRLQAGNACDERAEWHLRHPHAVSGAHAAGNQLATAVLKTAVACYIGLYTTLERSFGQDETSIEMAARP